MPPKLIPSGSSKNPASFIVDESTMTLLSKRSEIINQHNTLREMALKAAKKAEETGSNSYETIPDLANGSPVEEIDLAQREIESQLGQVSSLRSKIDLYTEEISSIDQTNTYLMIGIVLAVILIYFFMA